MGLATRYVAAAVRPAGARGARRAGPLLALAVGLAGCPDERAGAPSTEGGPSLRDVRGMDVPRAPGPNTIVPCRAIGAEAPRLLSAVPSMDPPEASVAPGLAFDELTVAHGDGGSGPVRVSVEAVRSDGRPYEDGRPATPDHPRVVSPSLAQTADGQVLAYLHSGAPPFRAYAVARPFGRPWSAPVLLSASDRAATRALAVGAGAAALVVFAEPGDETRPASLSVARVSEEGAVLLPARGLAGTDGVGGFALAAREGRVTLVVDVPSAVGPGRDLVVQDLRGSDAEPTGAAVVVAADRALVGSPAVVRLPPYPSGQSDDTVVVAWTQLDGGVSPEVYLARVGDEGFEDLVTDGAATGTSPALAPVLDEWFALIFRSPERAAVRMRLARPFRTGGLSIDDVFPLGSPTGALAAATSPDAWGIGLVWTETTTSGARVVYGTARCTDRE